MLRNTILRILLENHTKALNLYIKDYLDGVNDWCGKKIEYLPTDTLIDSTYKDLRILMDEFNIDDFEIYKNN